MSKAKLVRETWGRRKRSYTLVVDLSNKSAQIRRDDGKVLQAWSGVTLVPAVVKAQGAGWLPTEEWELLSPPDGYRCGCSYVGTL